MKYEMRSCGELGHKSRYCDTPSKWTLCAKEDHDFFKCPQSYAYKARAGPPSSPEEELTDARERESGRATDPEREFHPPCHSRAGGHHDRSECS